MVRLTHTGTYGGMQMQAACDYGRNEDSQAAPMTFVKTEPSADPPLDLTPGDHPWAESLRKVWVSFLSYFLLLLFYFLFCEKGWQGVRLTYVFFAARAHRWARLHANEGGATHKKTT